MCDSKKLNRQNTDLENADVNFLWCLVVNICKLGEIDFMWPADSVVQIMICVFCVLVLS